MSLREGIVLDYVARHHKEIAHAQRYPDVRRRSVIELAERCNYAPEHSHQIARLALALFDASRSTHALTDREREWLEYAALLHDVGVHISYERHHKHSHYLICNGDLRGFEPHGRRNDRADRSLSSARRSRPRTRGLLGSTEEAASRRTHARGDAPPRRNAGPQPLADRHGRHTPGRRRRRRADAAGHGRRRTRTVGRLQTRRTIRSGARQAAPLRVGPLFLC